MVKNKNNRSLIVVMSVCIAALITGNASMGVLLYRLHEKNVVLAEEVETLKQEKKAQETLTASLEERVNELNSMVSEQQQELEKAENAPEEGASAEEGMLSAPANAAEIPDVQNLAAGTVVDASGVGENLSACFVSLPIMEGDEVYNRINGRSYRENPNISLSELRYLKMLHYNFQHEVQVGEMIVNAGIAEDVLGVFRELFQHEYEIQSMYLVDNYWTGDGGSSDTASIDKNNTSAFNYREVTGGSSLSNHAYGCAIDLNPQQNPYVWYDGNGNLAWSHSNANPYVDRNSGDPHVVVYGDVCWSIFNSYGFSWGGSWSNPIDYQHFEKKV
ncbi:MAG: M15 family metallopeptidase [Eubacteriales bacterium]|nr:M15 family metallopeptidase [Eubacteriales bacterium]